MALLVAIPGAHRRGARLVGLCTGAYTLAEAGLLTGRRAAVHRHFAARYPDVPVEGDILFVDDGDILTSAGRSAALDLAVHIVRKDWGIEVATHVCRRLSSAPSGIWPADSISAYEGLVPKRRNRHCQKKSP
jgi:AraC family transcriptional activator FtrA